MGEKMLNESKKEALFLFFEYILQNNEDTIGKEFMFADDNNHTKQINLGFLMQNINLYEDIIRAQMENLRNENEDKNQKRKQKKNKKKNVKQNRGMNL